MPFLSYGTGPPSELPKRRPHFNVCMLVCMLTLCWTLLHVQ